MRLTNGFLKCYFLSSLLICCILTHYDDFSYWSFSKLWSCFLDCWCPSWINAASTLTVRFQVMHTLGIKCSTGMLSNSLVQCKVFIYKVVVKWNVLLNNLHIKADSIVESSAFDFKFNISIFQKSCSNLHFLLHIFWLLSGLQTLILNPTFTHNRVFEKIERGSCNYCLIGFFSQTAALKQLIGLYIGRCHACWKQPEVVQWLERNVKEVMKRVDRKDSFVEECSKK